MSVIQYKLCLKFGAHLFPAWIPIVEKLDVWVTQVPFRDGREVALYHTHSPSQHEGITIVCILHGTHLTSKFLCDFLVVFWCLLIITRVSLGQLADGKIGFVGAEFTNYVEWCAWMKN